METVKSLLVKFGTDTAQMEAGFKKADGLIERNAEKFKQAGRTMAVAGAAITGAFTLMIREYVKAGDELHKMSLRTSISVETLSALKFAAEISGASIDDIEKGIKKMSKTILDASDGLATYVRAFDRIGLSAEDLIELSPEEQFDKIAKAIAAVENPTIRAATAQDIFGRAGTKLLPLFAAGEEGLDKLKKRAHELGIVFDKEAADKAALLNDAMTDLKGSLVGASRSIVEALVPVITDLSGKISNIVIEVKDWVKENPKLTEVLVKVAAALGAVMLVAGPLLIALPGLSIAFKGMKGSIKKMPGTIKTLGSKLGSLKGVLGKTAAVGAAAFVGWKIGRLIGEITGLDKVIQNVAGKAIDKLGLWKGGVVELDDRTRLLAKRQKMLEDATEKVGFKITDVITANKILRGELINVDGKLKLAAIAITNVGKGTTDWATILKKQGIPSIEEFNDEVSRLTQKKKFLKAALDAGRIKLQTYKVEVGKVNSELNSLTGKTEEAKEATKTWADFLKDNQIMTIEETGDKIVELEGFLDGLDKAYKDKKISLEAYTEATRLLKDELAGINTTIVTQVLPPVRDMAGVFDQSVTDMKTKIGEFPPVAKKAMEDAAETIDIMETRWGDVIKGMSGAFGQFVFDVLSTGSTFSENLTGLWEGIKNTFKSVVADMATEWAENFLKKIITGTASAAADVVSSVAKTGEGVVSTISGIGGAATAALTGLGAAVGTFLGSLIGKKTTGWQKEIQKQGLEQVDFLHNIRDLIQNDVMAALKEQTKQAWRRGDQLIEMIFQSRTQSKLLGSLEIKGDRIVDHLKVIAKFQEAIKSASEITAARLKSLAGFKTGGSFVPTKPTLITVDPREEVRITPFNKMAPAGSGGGDTFHLHFSITDQIDPYTADRMVKKVIAPALLNVIRNNPSIPGGSGGARTQFKEALGVT